MPSSDFKRADKDVDEPLFHCTKLSIALLGSEKVVDGSKLALSS